MRPSQQVVGWKINRLCNLVLMFINKLSNIRKLFNFIIKYKTISGTNGDKFMFLIEIKRSFA